MFYTYMMITVKAGFSMLQTNRFVQCVVRIYLKVFRMARRDAVNYIYSCLLAPGKLVSPAVYLDALNS